MAAEKDPLTQLNDTTQSILQKSPAMRLAMGPKIKNFGGVYDVNTQADVPRIIIEQVGGPANINAASNWVTFDYTTNVMIDSGNQRIAIINPILWALLATVASALTSSDLTAMKWRGQSFCKSFRVTSLASGQANPQMNIGTTGLVAVCVIVFSLGFNKPDLAAFAAGN